MWRRPADCALCTIPKHVRASISRIESYVLRPEHRRWWVQHIYVQHIVCMHSPERLPNIFRHDLDKRATYTHIEIPFSDQSAVRFYATSTFFPVCGLFGVWWGHVTYTYIYMLQLSCIQHARTHAGVFIHEAALTWIALYVTGIDRVLDARLTLCVDNSVRPPVTEKEGLDIVVLQTHTSC